MPDTLRVVFIGCGRQASANLYPHLAALPEAGLVACCDLQESLARRNAERFHIPAHYTDWERMLAEEAPDAVFVVGPPMMHTEIGGQILERGLPLFTEKPVARTLAEARQLARLAEEKGVPTQVGHMLPHAPASKLARTLMAGPEFGRPVFLESKYFVPGPRRVIWEAPTLDWTYMLVQAVHPVDWARHMLGDLVSVSCSRGEGANGAVAYVVAAEFANGAAGLINMTSCAPHVVAEMEIVGDGGAFIHIANMESIRYEGGAWPYPRVHDYGRRQAGYFDEVQDFCRCLLRGEPTYATFADEVKALEICQAICESADAGGRRVPVATEQARRRAQGRKRS